MKKTLLTLATAVAATALPSLVQAQDSPLSFNVSVTSDYRYRGISQTRLKPALQGGLDYALPGGFYVGAWGSTIKWIKDWDVKGSVELDLYGGYKGEIIKDVGFDVGLLHYAYLGNKLADAGGGGIFKNADTTEVYGGVTYGPATLKVSYSVGNLFGNFDFANDKKTSGSLYTDLSATFDVAGFSVTPHIGHQKVAKLSVASYTDYSLTVSKELVKGLSLSVALVGTDADDVFYTPGPVANSTKFLGKNGGVVSLKYAF